MDSFLLRRTVAIANQRESRGGLKPADLRSLDGMTEVMPLTAENIRKDPQC
jgi:hypothetical protein